jgi:PAS domain S-box-containing protein
MSNSANKPIIRLLLVDDDLVDRLTCKRELQKYLDCEFEVLEAETGEQGLKLARTERLDCILLDQNLPDFNGVEFLAEFADESGEQPVPVVMLTGFDNSMLAVEALKLGAYDYIVKGTEREPLQWLPAVVFRALREHQTIKDKIQAEQELLKAEAKYLQQLEELVAQRTAQLAQQNVALNSVNANLDQTLNDLKRTEADLRIAATAFQAQESILVTDTNRIILRVNEAFTRITGYSAQEAIGKTPAILQSGLHDEAFYGELFNTVTREGYWEGEIWNRHKNGDIFPVLQTITAVTNEDGQIIHYVGASMDITPQKQAERILLDARERLENQVANTQDELEKSQAETAEINTALSVLLKHREKDKDEAQISLSNEIEAIVMPLLKRMKGASNGQIQTQRMIGMIEDNLKNLMKSYGRANHMDAAYQKLSPIERQVASMVKLGQPTKVIAATLNITAGTVNIHRKHIRKKLDLDGKTNLQGYLQSLTD